MTKKRNKAKKKRQLKKSQKKMVKQVAPKATPAKNQSTTHWTTKFGTFSEGCFNLGKAMLCFAVIALVIYGICQGIGFKELMDFIISFITAILS